jgi:hypothetical protein
LLEVNCLCTPFSSLTPLHTLPTKRTFIYIQTTLTCLLLLSSTQTLLRLLIKTCTVIYVGLWPRIRETFLILSWFRDVSIGVEHICPSECGLGDVYTISNNHYLSGFDVVHENI